MMNFLKKLFVLTQFLFLYFVENQIVKNNIHFEFGLVFNNVFLIIFGINKRTEFSI